jgi:hypothetical protein
MAPLLESMVTTNHIAFIQGRCLHENFILVKQTVKTRHHQKVPTLFLNLDITKAFDLMLWSLILEVMRHLGFGMSWCKLISNMLATSSTRILLNDESGEIIQHQCELLQGDPLSPMLFILVMSRLNSLFIKTGTEGLLQTLSRHVTRQRLSLYTDNVAFFIKPVEDEMQVIICISSCTSLINKAT